MAVVSVTHLRIRSPRFLLPFFWLSYRCIRQMQASSGFVRATGFFGVSLRFYTVSLWRSHKEMQAYIAQGPHRETFAKSKIWCSEISVGHMESNDESLPKNLAEALVLLKAAPKFMPLPHANAFHLAKHHVQDRLVVRVPDLGPR